MNNPVGAVAPLLSPAFIADPYPTYRQYLAGPVLQALPVRPNIWGVFRYDACSRVLREPALSARRAEQWVANVPEEELGEFAAFSEHISRWLLLRDAPAHTRLRRLMNKGFAPLSVAGLRPRVLAAIDELLADTQSAADFDVIRDFAYPLPVRIISDLLGLPRSSYARTIALSTDIANWFGNLRRSAADARSAQAAALELVREFEVVASQRPTGGLLELLLDIADTEPDITPQDVYAQCVLLLLAGHETTRNLIGNGMLTLLRNPQALEELRAEPAGLAGAIEEILRFESPVQAFGRSVTAPLELDGTRIDAGSLLIVFIAAAHRDPARCTQPDTFDIHRKHQRHMAFGADAHVCLGSTLARLEGELALSALIQRFPRMRLQRSSPDWSSNFAFRGLRSLPVTLG